MSRIATVICAAVAVAAGGYWLSLSNSNSSNLLVSTAEAQEAEIDTSTVIEMVQGAEDAPVEIIEYASFTCPHCASFHQGAYKQLKKDFIDTGKVKFTYREVYFDRYGLWASMVARCAGPEKFFGLTDVIYEKQSEWTRAGGPAEIVDELRKIGRLAGIDGDQLEACLQDGTKARTLAAWYQENAERDGIQATPSFIVNGKKVDNQSYADFKKLIEAELGS
ncbi:MULTISPECIES: DsbA family protein [unclassified Ruegeria]|uniref:DsbA family protein n=1 Tax=unclassified Ruegeria TaxID=2625375 RepID=UPI0014883C21|nr:MULTISPECIES: DsbA family protein [unclassified Ruegeria]NOD33026.1 thioredoxin domain-containing protein [Ruegeria sp. HKCCD7296]NOE42740.1 thioredoxin domain-containing protein [Ruegeria sp. HKCCD7319]